ncbi:MAG: hypothetical protein WBY94_09025 [Polyangiaceae bacterium]
MSTEASRTGGGTIVEASSDFAPEELSSSPASALPLPLLPDPDPLLVDPAEAASWSEGDGPPPGGEPPTAPELPAPEVFAPELLPAGPPLLEPVDNGGGPAPPLLLDEPEELDEPEDGVSTPLDDPEFADVGGLVSAPVPHANGARATAAVKPTTDLTYRMSAFRS